LGRFIADFYCHEAKLAIEIDGSIHDLIKNAEYDEGRSIELAENEIKILRFSNSDIYFCLDLVLEQISNTLTGKM
jgi:very-short-patch-repair endonuclease